MAIVYRCDGCKSEKERDNSFLHKVEFPYEEYSREGIMKKELCGSCRLKIKEFIVKELELKPREVGPSGFNYGEAEG